MYPLRQSPAMTRPPPPEHLPTRDGTRPSCVALPAGPWERLVDFLVARFGHVPGPSWHQRMAHGDVLGAGGEALDPATPYQAGSRVYYFRAVPPEPEIPFGAPVLFEDEHILVADKPHFLPVVPSGRHLHQTLLMRLRRERNEPDLVPLHRIDRDTAGLVLFSRQSQSRGAYVALFREQRVHKSYGALAPWRADLAWPLERATRLEPGAHRMQMQEVPGAPNAFTRIECEEQRGGWARYRLTPRTGKRHQLRVQMASLGLPLLHDAIYPVLQPELPAGSLPDLSRPLGLLARQLVFIDPVTGQSREFMSARTLTWPIA